MQKIRPATGRPLAFGVVGAPWGTKKYVPAKYHAQQGKTPYSGEPSTTSEFPERLEKKKPRGERERMNRKKGESM